MGCSMTSSYGEQCSSTWAPGTEACRRTASERVKSEKPRVILDWKIDRHCCDCKPLLHHHWDLTVAGWRSNRYLRLVAAATTLVGVCSCVGDGHQSTQVANVNLVRIRSFKQALFEELSSTVSNLTVAFHLPKTETAITASDTSQSISIRTINQTAQQRNWPWSALHRLPVEDLDRAPGPWMNLIVHHVF